MIADIMFLLGFFSLCQIILIPGIILLKLFKFKTAGLIQFLLYSFGLSLYFNYLLVCILTWLKLYTASVIYILFIVELLYLAYFLYGNFHLIQSGKTLNEYYLLLKNYLLRLKVGHKLLLAVSFFTILFFISLIPFTSGTTYYFIDALNHWTRWPVQWASNTFPPGTRHYPQLFPANLSLIYVFTGEIAFQFFPKALMPFFFISILLIYFDLAVYRKSVVDLLSLLTYSVILLIFYSVLFILEVNADIPVSFFSFLTFYAIIRNEDKGFDIKTIILVTIFASSAALTKLAGSYILALTGLWVIYVYYKNRKSISFHSIIKTVVCILLLLFGSIFWYLFRPSDMLQGLDQSIYLVPDYYTRFVSAVKMLFFTFSLPFSLFLLITVTASLFTKQARYIVILIIIPALILWAFFFSADFRNISFAIPFIAYSSGYGLWFIYKKIDNGANDIKIPIPVKSFLKNKTLLPVILILLLISTFIIAGTDIVFNFSIYISYLLNKIAFGSYRVSYYNEIGYYKYVEYIINAFRLSCIILFVLFAVRWVNIKISYLLLFILISSLIMGSLFLPKETMWKMQLNDKKMVSIHNLYTKVYPFTDIPVHNCLIITNDSTFSKLIFRPEVHAHYIRNINQNNIQQNLNFKDNYLLLAKDRLKEETLNFIASEISLKKLKVCFEDEEFIFLEK
jgi:hypothetical protein